MKKLREIWFDTLVLFAAIIGITSALLCAVSLGKGQKTPTDVSTTDVVILTLFGFLFALLLAKRIVHTSKKILSGIRITIIIAIILLAIQQIIRNYRAKDEISVAYQSILWTRLLAGFPIVFLLRERTARNDISKKATIAKNSISIPANFIPSKEDASKILLSEKKNSVIEKLIELRESNIITEEEFVQLRSKLILSDFLLGLYN